MLTVQTARLNLTNMKTNAGFTLIEVLIAMVILAVGLLGLAALQATSLRNDQSAYNRSQATQLAYDMADRIRANPVESFDRAYAVPNTLAASAYAVAVPLAQASCDSSPGCTPALMAQNDRQQWNANIANTLPRGTGTVTVNAPNRTFTITVTWDDNRTGAADTNFAMSFQL